MRVHELKFAQPNSKKKGVNLLNYKFDHLATMLKQIIRCNNIEWKSSNSFQMQKSLDKSSFKLTTRYSFYILKYHSSYYIVICVGE